MKVPRLKPGTDDETAFHYAVGLLLGYYIKHKDTNRVVYHERVRVKIEWIERDMVEEDL